MATESKAMLANYHAVTNDINGEEPSSQKKSSRTCNPVNFYWVWELLATVASFACIVAIGVILARMHGKALDHWSFTISLNATVAIFITAAKSLALLVIGACIAQAKWVRFKTSARTLSELDLFESAARGPLGSLILLFTVRWRVGIAGAGALVTILALGVDAFAQQVIKLETRDVQTSRSDGSFGLSQGYNGTAKWLVPMGYDVDDASVDIAMEGAIMEGIYGRMKDPLFKCNSSCVWKDSYISLGLTSQCKNVTEETLSSNPNTTAMVENYGSTTYAMTTPGQIAINATVESMYRTQIQVATKVNRPKPSANRTSYDPSSPETFSPDFINVAVLRRRPDLPPGGGFNEDRTPGLYFPEVEVLECTIGLTAYNYSGLSASGNTLSLQTTQIPLDPGAMSGGSHYYYGYINFNQTSLPGFEVMAADVVALANLFESPRFTGEMTIGQLKNKTAGGVVMALLKSNITETFQSIANSMTEQLRSSQDGVAEGIEVASVVFVRIQWGWLGLPVGVTVVAAIFLFATMFNSRAHQCEPWKSSTIATIFHNITTEGNEHVVLTSELRTLAEMEQRAKGVKAILR